MKTQTFTLYALAWAFCRRVHGELLTMEHGWIVFYA